MKNTSKTYYVVQVGRNLYLGEDGPPAGGYVVGIDSAGAFSFGKARRRLREEVSLCGRDEARRFPRIVKIMVEAKVIQERR